jgi:hypothetical protein
VDGRSSSSFHGCSPCEDQNSDAGPRTSDLLFRKTHSLFARSHEDRSQMCRLYSFVDLVRPREPAQDRTCDYVCGEKRISLKKRLVFKDVYASNMQAVIINTSKGLGSLPIWIN